MRFISRVNSRMLMPHGDISRKRNSFFSNCLFFGEESDPPSQQRLMGNVSNHGFLDISERKILIKFRQVDEVMKILQGEGE